MSRGIKLVLMGVAGAALLYSCSPGIGAGLGALPYLWFLSNPFYRPPVTAPCPPGAPNCGQQASQSSGGGGSGSALSRGGSTTTDTSKAAPSYSQRGGFGATGSSGGSSGAS